MESTAASVGLDDLVQTERARFHSKDNNERNIYRFLSVYRTAVTGFYTCRNVGACGVGAIAQNITYSNKPTRAGDLLRKNDVLATLGREAMF